MAAPAALLLMASGATAGSSLDDWYNEACPDKALQRWCVPTLRGGGWTLKYRTQSPEELADVSWLIEVWVKDRDALVCELRTGRGGVKSNGCYSLQEVAPQR